MSTSQQNMRLMKIAATAAIFGAMTLSGCKSSNEGTTTKESGKKAASTNNKRVSAVFQNDALTATIHSEHRMENNEPVKNKIDPNSGIKVTQGTIVPFSKYEAELTAEKYEESWQKGGGRSDSYFPTNTQNVAFYKDSPREIKIAEANKDPTSLKWGHMVAVNNEKQENIESDAKVSNKSKLTYLVSYVDDNGDQKFVTLKRNQFLLDASTDSSANKTGYITLKFDVDTVRTYTEGLKKCYQQVSMADFITKMKAATTEITADNYRQCTEIHGNFNDALEACENKIFNDEDKRRDAKKMLETVYGKTRVKNFNADAYKKHWTMVDEQRAGYNAALAACNEKVATVKPAGA